MAVIEKLEIDGNLDFWIDEQSKLNIKSERQNISLKLDRLDTIAVLSGLSKQLESAEIKRRDEQRSVYFKKFWPW